MNKQLKLLQKSKVLQTLEVEKVKHNLSKIENSNIVMVAYDDATNKFLIGDNSGNLYVATPEYLNSLDVKNTNIENFISNLTKSSIAEHFNKVTIQEVRKMFGDKYFYYWSANDKVYGVRTRLIEQLDNGPDNTKVVELWDRSENVLSNDRGVTGLKEVKFSAELRPAFLTFSENALPTYTRDKNLVVRDPVEIADIMNKDLQNHDYVPNGKKYGYDMKDSNAVLKSYLCTDDLVVLSNIDKREVIDIDPPTVDPDNPDVEYSNNTPFNHNYNMIWSTIRSARLFEEFNDENEDNHSQFANMTRHEQNELVRGLISNNGTRHVDASGLYANIPNLYHTYTTYIEGDRFGEKQIYNNGSVGISIKNEIKWSLDSINGKNCVVTKRVYNSITGEVENAKRTYDAVINYTVDQIKDNNCRVKKEIRVPVLNNAICDINKFEQKLDSSGTAISLPVPNEYNDGIVEYSLDTSKYSQGTNGEISYGLRKIFIQSGAIKVLVSTISVTGKANFSIYTLGSNATTATIKRTTEIIFKNTDGTNYNFKTSNNGIGTGEVSYSVAATPTSVSGSNHRSKHTRTVSYLSGSTNVRIQTDDYEGVISYRIYTLEAGSLAAILKGSSTSKFNIYLNGVKTGETYNIVQNNHISVVGSISISDIISPDMLNAAYLQLAVEYTYNGVTIRVIKRSNNTNIYFVTYEINEHENSITLKKSYTPTIKCISDGVEITSNYISETRTLSVEYRTIIQTLTVANHANDYNFRTTIKDGDETIFETDSMNICDRLGGGGVGVSIEEAASMLLKNTNGAKYQVYIGDYFELGGYTWQNNSGTTFPAGTAKYVLVERTSDGHLIFMSAERHKLTSEKNGALSWEDLITNNKLETILLPQLKSILGVTPVSYTRKSNVPHLTNKRVFLPTEYEIFGKYKYQVEYERYSGERQWEIFNFNKELDRRKFRLDVITGDINNYVSSDSNNSYGYWLATNCSYSYSVSRLMYPNGYDYGYSDYHDDVTYDRLGVRPCFML